MTDRTIRIVIDPTAAEAGAARVNKALASIGQGSTSGASAALADIENRLRNLERGLGTNIAANDRFSSANDRVAESSKRVSQALETEAQKQQRIADMVQRSIDKMNAQAAAAQRSANAFKGGQTVMREPGTLARQNAMMGLPPNGKIDLSDAANGVKKLGQDVDKVTNSLHMNAGAFREIIVLIREASRGDFTRMAGSASLLAQRLGAFEVVGYAAVGVFAAVAAAVGIVTYALVKGQTEFNRYNNLLKLSGDYAGLAGGGYIDLANKIATATNTSVRSNESLVAGLAATHRLTKTEIEEVSTASQQMARALGEDATKVAGSFLDISKGPGEVAKEISDKYPKIIEPAMARHIAQLDEAGKATQAWAELSKTYYDNVAKNVEDNTGTIVHLWRDAIKSISDAWNDLLQMGVKNDAVQLENLRKQLAQRGVSTVGHPAANGVLDIAGRTAARALTGPEYDIETNAMRQTEVLLAQRVKSEQAAADAAKDNAVALQKQADAMRVINALAGGVDKPFLYSHDKAGLAQALRDAPNTPEYNYYRAHPEQLYEALKRRDMPQQYRSDRKEDRMSVGDQVERATALAINSTALRYRGLDEKRDNITLRDFLASGGIQIDPAKTAWCAAFVNAVLATNGLPTTHSLSAASFANYGSETKKPQVGDIIVSRRQGGAHVGFFEGKNSDGSLRVLGGNTGNKVGVESVPLNQVITMRTLGNAGEQALKQQVERQKKEDEFYKTLKDEATVATMLPMEAAKYTAEQKLAKDYGDEWKTLSEDELKTIRAKISASVEERALNQSVLDLRKAARDTENEVYVKRNSSVGLTRQEQQVQDALNARRLATLNQYDTLEAGLKAIESERYQTEEARLAVILRQNAALDEQNRKYQESVDRGKSLIDRYASPQLRDQMDMVDFKKRRDDVVSTTYSDQFIEQFGSLAPVIRTQVLSAMDAASREISDRWVTRMGSAVEEIASGFGGKIGSSIERIARSISALTTGVLSGFGLILSGISKLLDDFKAKDNRGNSFGTLVEQGRNDFMTKMFGGTTSNGTTLKSAFKDPIENMGASFKDFKASFSSANGGFVAGLGKAIGGAMQGAAIGDATAAVGKAIWKKYSTTGAEIGGALGSVFGPIGSFVGAIGGGIIGGLLRGSKTGASTITLGSNGDLSGNTITGNSQKLETAAKGLGKNVVSGIRSIASQLGGEITGTPKISIGIRDGNYRVDPTGQGITKVKRGAIDFGKDGEQDAIQYAVTLAVKQGVITGISRFSQQLLGSSNDLDFAVDLATKWEGVLKDVAALDNPAKAAFDDINKGFTDLITAMQKNGATSDEIATAERDRQAKLKDALKEQLSTLTDLQKFLRGDNTGTTKLSRLTSDMSDLQHYKTDIAAGKSIDQSAFSSLVQEIVNLGGDLYGTASPDFQNLLQDVKDATASAINGVQATYDATVAALQAQTDTLNTTLNLNNDLTRQTNETLQNIAALLSQGVSFSGANMATLNGMMAIRNV